MTPAPWTPLIPSRLKLEFGLPIPPVPPPMVDMRPPPDSRRGDCDFEIMWGLQVEAVRFNFIIMPRGASVLIPMFVPTAAPRLAKRFRSDFSIHRRELVQRQLPTGIRVWRTH